MQKAIDYVKKLWFRTTWGPFNQELPRSLTAFQAYAERLMFAYDIPYRPSYESTLATMIMHLDQTKSRFKPTVLVARVRKAMANNVAYDRIEYHKAAERKEAQAVTDAVLNGKDSNEKAPTLSISSAPAGMVQ